ncbi:MAG: hypothetical protein ACI9UR_000541 [Bacteroidia bacterium]|jgi:uncharacterized protein (DUF983 family)
MKKGSKIYSVLRLKCPRCHEGDLFLHKNAYSVSKIEKMPDNCPVCDQKYWPEPGFYYGAMYVSYALTIALSVAIFVAMTVLWRFEVLWYLGINAVSILLLFPPIFRVSRAVWANIFMHYNPNSADLSKR